ncbi:hypothetical protein PPYR_12909 [Photinus pyralis]|uniref:Uncharacterized protein n=1 Tax=Photinus pyralis TaxID=7054 RepID=A0A1Y1K2K0_PHOPY|nr:uncharacterized protein LOC116177787 [Photinus pyralis]KAB0793289.1 hypothetical protein PPYR_12909 [Photinus pyralis]
MDRVLLLLFTVVVLANAGEHKKIRVYFKQCEKIDDECIRINAQKVVDLIPIDKPLEVDEWTIKPTKILNYEQHYKNIKMYNHHQGKVAKAHLDANEAESTWKLEMDVYVPEVVLSGDYEFKPGSTLYGVDVASKGKVSYFHRGYNVTLTLSGTVTFEDKAKFTATDSKLLMSADAMAFDFKTGDPKVDERITAVYRDNFHAIFEDAGDQYAEMYAKVYQDIANDLIFDKEAN